jgi:CBS domain containing-hemolysin-like protein
MDPYSLIRIILLVLLNGFFVAAEFAIVKVRQSQIGIQEKQWHKIAPLAKHITDHLDAYLSATQLGITLASLWLWWIGEEAMSHNFVILFDRIGRGISSSQITFLSTAFAFSVITALHIIFWELAPKSIAIRYSLGTTLVIAWPLQVFYFIFRPVIRLLNLVANGTLKLIWIGRVWHDEVHTQDEIRLLLTESEEQWAIQQSSNELIQNVFEFDDRMVKQIYVPRNKMSAVNIDRELSDIMKYIIGEWYSRYPVYQKDQNEMIGILHTKDLLWVLYERNIDKTKLKQMMRPAMFVPLTQKLQNLLNDFQLNHQMIALVTNEFGEIAWLVTIEDVIEELIWEIQDEYDNESTGIIKNDNGEYSIQGSCSVMDVNDHLPNPLPLDPNYETIAWFVQWIFGRMPQMWETITYQWYEIKVIKIKKHVIEMIKIKEI